MKYRCVEGAISEIFADLLKMLPHFAPFFNIYLIGQCRLKLVWDHF